jgi:hypothetical protein
MNGDNGHHGSLGAGDLVLLEARVRWEVGSRVQELQLTVEGNRLVLRGRTHSYYIKQLAQQAILQMTPLQLIRNEIEVFERPIAEQG